MFFISALKSFFFKGYKDSKMLELKVFAALAGTYFITFTGASFWLSILSK